MFHHFSNKQLEFSGNFGENPSQLDDSTYEIVHNENEKKPLKKLNLNLISSAPNDDDIPPQYTPRSEKMYSQKKLTQKQGGGNMSPASNVTSQTQTTNQGGRNLSSVSSWNNVNIDREQKSAFDLDFIQKKRNIRRFKQDFPEFSMFSEEKILQVFRFYKKNVQNRDFNAESPSSIAIGAIIIFIMRVSLNIGIIRN